MNGLLRNTNNSAAYFSGNEEAAPSAVRAQPFADVRHLPGHNLGVRPHEPETTGMELAERLLGQGEFLRRTGGGWAVAVSFMSNP